MPIQLTFVCLFFYLQKSDNSITLQILTLTELKSIQLMGHCSVNFH
jgi:hypothetical protein